MKIKVQYTLKLSKEQEAEICELVERAFNIPADEIKKSDIREYLVLQGVAPQWNTDKLKIKKGRKLGRNYAK